MILYTPKYFRPEELLDRATFERFGATGLRYFRPEILRALDFIRENYPTSEKRGINVNNWVWGGKSEWRGLRMLPSTDYKPYSGHSWGAAVDMVPNGITSEQMRQWILMIHNQVKREGCLDHPIMGVRRMEKGTDGWVHIDALCHGSNDILMVNP